VLTGTLKGVFGLPPELQGALLDRRVVWVRGRLDDNTAGSVMSQLLLLSRTAQGRPIELYVDSPGGSLSAALAIYDVLGTLESPVSTTCLAVAGGAAVLLAAAGAAGLRFALPHARLQLTDESAELQPTHRPADIARQAAEAAGLRERWRAALAQHAAHSLTQIEHDLAAGRWLSAAEARDYGLVDAIIPTPRG
jgi:ATP-dependent Clp protease protease subunit